MPSHTLDALLSAILRIFPSPSNNIIICRKLLHEVPFDLALSLHPFLHRWNPNVPFIIIQIAMHRTITSGSLLRVKFVGDRMTA